MTIKVYKTKKFARFARKEGLTDEELLQAVEELGTGLDDGDLGGKIYKKRVARPGRGKSAGFRTLVLFAKGKRVVFMHGFAKNVKSNISEDELQQLKDAGKIILGYTAAQMEAFTAANVFKEVKND